MSLKSILLVFATVLLGLSSCTEETAIDVHPKEGFTNKLTFVLSTSPTITKADGATQIATADELNISNCILAIFESEDSGIGKKVCITSYADMTSDDVASNDPPRYSVSLPEGVSLKFAKTYKIIIIANPGDPDAYIACGTYDALEAVVESTMTADDAYNFTPSTLLKKGELSVGANTDTPLSSGMLSPTIPLTQLAARIDLKIKVDLGEKKLTRTYYEFEEGENIVEMKDLTNTKLEAMGAKEVKHNNQLAYKLEEISDIDLFYQERKLIITGLKDAQVKKMLLEDCTATSVKEYTSNVIDLETITLNNVRTKVQAMLPLNDLNKYLLTTPIDLMRFGNAALQYVTFYTYARSLETDSPLRVALTGTVYEANVKEQTKVTCDLWFVCAKDELNYNNIVTTTINPVTLEAHGWGKGLMIPFEYRGNGYVEVPGTDEIVENTKVAKGDYKGGFNIPRTPGELMNGNRYLVTATIKNLSMPVTLNWEVNSWSNVTIDIPEFK